MKQPIAIDDEGCTTIACWVDDVQSIPRGSVGFFEYDLHSVDTWNCHFRKSVVTRHCDDRLNDVFCRALEDDAPIAVRIEVHETIEVWGDNSADDDHGAPALYIDGKVLRVRLIGEDEWHEPAIDMDTDTRWTQ